MTTADLQTIGNFLKNQLRALAVGFLQPSDLRHHRQRVAVRPHHAGSQFPLQCFQRLLDQRFAMAMADHDVFLVSLEIIHVGQRDQFQALAESGAEMSAPGFLAFGRQAGQLCPVEPAGAGQRLFESLQSDRFKQIGDRVGIEGVQRVFAVGRDEDERGGVGQCRQPPRGFQTIQAGHLDIQQDDIGL